MSDTTYYNLILGLAFRFFAIFHSKWRMRIGAIGHQILPKNYFLEISIIISPLCMDSNGAKHWNEHGVLVNSIGILSSILSVTTRSMDLLERSLLDNASHPTTQFLRVRNAETGKMIEREKKFMVLFYYSRIKIILSGLSLKKIKRYKFWINFYIHFFIFRRFLMNWRHHSKFFPLESYLNSDWPTLFLIDNHATFFMEE